MFEFLLVLAIGLLLWKGWVFFFAGGVEADIRAPWPKGEDSLYPLTLGPIQAAASQAATACNFEMTVPFAFTTDSRSKAYLSAGIVTVGTAVTIKLEDDAGTPQVLIAAVATTVVTAGASVEQELTVVSGITVDAGAQLRVIVDSGANDLIEAGCITLWVKPKF